mmetsp:Transcript_39584/g.65785  ORF Transcript_39584/g.65785 Transcript_39584/m.65785 type:complete len:103 (+) Transcript_39584:734-1042(+)
MLRPNMMCRPLEATGRCVLHFLHASQYKDDCGTDSSKMAQREDILGWYSIQPLSVSCQSSDTAFLQIMVASPPWATVINCHWQIANCGRTGQLLSIRRYQLL